MAPFLRFTKTRWPLEAALLVFTVGILSLYTYGTFTRSLLLGFDWLGEEYRVVWALSSVSLRPGDGLLRLGSIDLKTFGNDLRWSMLDEIQPGQSIPAVVLRDGKELTLAYTAPGPTPDEFYSRLISQVWLGWLFWVFGLLTYISVRPRDTRWRLLIAFYGLTALWLGASNLSRWHLWESAVLMRMAMWLCVPVYWHLHWVFPDRLPQLRRWPWARAFGYVAAGVLAVLEWFQALPTSLFFYGFGLALLGLIIPLGARLFSKTQPRQTRTLGYILLCAVIPLLALTIYAQSGGTDSNALAALLALPLLPIGYFYAALRPQLGWLELRANRLIALYLFALLLIVLATITTALAVASVVDTRERTLVAITGIVAVGLLAAMGFPAFQRWVEHHILNIPLPPRHLLGRFLASINASLDRATLARVLSDAILPSLQITQSALLSFDGEQSIRWLYSREVGVADLPEAASVAHLMTQAGQPRTPMDGEPASQPWVRLALRLAVEDKTVGLWLLGRRDPDDLYTQTETQFLQVLADQIALALLAMAQTEQLRATYRADMDRRETESMRLARDLHDVVLNNLAGLRNSVGPTPPPGFLEAYNRAVTSLRESISGLRPPLLDYGLYQALKALASDHDYRDERLPSLTFALPESAERYDAHVEQHLFRILHQAYDNALQHAQAGALTLSGQLLPGHIDLWIEDDGVGLGGDASKRESAPTARKHFGLRNMHERAALIGATLTIDAMNGQGTRVRVQWRSPSE